MLLITCKQMHNKLSLRFLSVYKKKDERKKICLKITWKSTFKKKKTFDVTNQRIKKKRIETELPHIPSHSAITTTYCCNIKYL